MSNPFEVLGLRPWADPSEIRAAYRTQVKLCHPDLVQDPEARKSAQERLVRLNLAYEEALHLAKPRHISEPAPEISCEEAVRMSEKMLEKGSPESALRQLMRTEKRSVDWYAQQGRVLMAMEQYDSAHQSFRQAIRLEPDNEGLWREAFNAVMALREAQSLHGRVRKIWKNVTRK